MAAHSESRRESRATEPSLDACPDRQIWRILIGPQEPLALGGDAAKRIGPRYGPITSAIALYRKLGFGERRLMTLTVLEPF